MKLIRPIPSAIMRPVSVLVVVAWLVCMALLVHRSYLQAAPANLATDLARYGPTATWRGVYYRGRFSTCGLRAACAGGGDPAGRPRLERTLGHGSAASMPAERRPFGARRNTAKLEVERSDSAARVRSARSGSLESALSVHAAPDAVGNSAYSRRQRQSVSEATLPGVRSRTPPGRHTRGGTWGHARTEHFATVTALEIIGPGPASC